ncbi:MAG TPA: FkbM family methyltransferase [Syntrophorhabdaceae bacterium]|nr:FkbM family methyltransferase [Syntrophorhabdaceae bacterium]
MKERSAGNNAIRFLKRILFERLLPRAAYPVLCGPLKGARFKLGAISGEGGGASVYFNMVEPEQTSVFVNTLKNGMVFFDIGANVGYYTILGARLVGAQGKVFAFEPAIRNLAYLYRHIVLNKAKNVTILSVACSDRMSLKFFTAGKNFAEGHIVEKDDTSGAQPIPAISVDEVVRKTGCCPDVIKIDVEGVELSVLKGARDVLYKARPKLFLSTHSDTHQKTCIEYLKECGYTYEALNKNTLNPSEFLAYYAEK